MKLALITLSMIASTSFAHACPFTASAKVYTEIVVPCNGETPDYSQGAFVNQAYANGGECRVDSEDASFTVVGQELYLNNKAVGTLLSKPSCYQIDNGEPYSASWVQVLLH